MCDPLNSTPIFTPARDGLCCKAVRRVPGRDMLCIAQLLSPLERVKYSAVKICSFKDACDWTSSKVKAFQSSNNSYTTVEYIFVFDKLTNNNPLL
ncbi:hypothetical protein HU200_016660 [Digitaria exilis]|uniref:Uncharacterized protein n=1 Tax=Digitaria exilis TaxID=1010633 RepID=A0A835KKL9_9POAL|nr:hypothetical protein HU200_016660 [Digitaria exilis]